MKGSIFQCILHKPSLSCFKRFRCKHVRWLLILIQPLMHRKSESYCSVTSIMPSLHHLFTLFILSPAAQNCLRTYYLPLGFTTNNTQRILLYSQQPSLHTNADFIPILNLFLVDKLILELQIESVANEELMRLQCTCSVPWYQRADNKN